MQGHWQAFLIAAASSTDNFIVGVSVGLSILAKGSMHGLIWSIAICNAGTALATALFGEQIAAVIAPSLQNFMAGAVFIWLAWNEVNGEDEGEANVCDEKFGAVSQIALFIQLALPMSLNNMAGGVASGVAGVSATVAATYALLVSVVFMEVGVALGRFWKNKAKQRREQLQNRANSWSCVLYIVLGMQCFYSAAF